MEYGLIHLRNFVQYGGDLAAFELPRLRRGKRNDLNANARQERPRSAPPQSSSSGSTWARTISSDASLRSIGLETPLGVIRQSSLSNEDLVRMHSATSQDQFKMSMHKLKSMPAINEDESSPEEDELPNDKNTPTKRKVKRRKPKKVPLKKNSHHFIEEKDETEEEQEPVKVTNKGVKKFFRGLFSCTKAQKYEKSDALLKGTKI